MGIGDRAAVDGLIRRIQAGDREAFGELYELCVSFVYTQCRGMLRSHHDAEDATQGIFEKVLRSLHRYRVGDGAPFPAWLSRIVRNHLIDLIAKNDRCVPEDPAVLDSYPSTDDTTADLAADYDADEVLGWIKDGDLAIFARQLSPTQAEVINLRFRDGLTVEEIAQAIEKTPAAVRQHLSRSLKRLRELLAVVGRKEYSDQPYKNTGMVVLVRQPPVLRERRFALFN